MAVKRMERGTTGGKFAMDIGGEQNWIFSVEGGGQSSEVVTSKIGGSLYSQKNIGNVKYEDIKVSCGAGMSKGFWEWIEASLKMEHTRKDGAIIACNYDGEEMGRLNFFQALISEIGFPALDAASKDASKLALSFSPEHTRNIPKTGGKVKAAFKRDQILWSPANFRIQSEGLGKSLGRVNKIEALVLKQKVTENPAGDLRDYEKEPSSVEVPNLVVTLAESHADEFYHWHEDFVIKGNCGHDKEKNFAIQYLDQSRQHVLLELELLRCGIFKLTPDKLEGQADAIRRVKCEMYVEELHVKANKFWG